MPVEEFIVSNVQWLLPTWFLRLLVRLYLRYSGGPALRGGDVVIKQIHVDGRLTEASASLPSSTPCQRQNTRRASSAPQPRPAASSWQVSWLAGLTRRCVPHRWTRSSGARSP